MKRTETGMVALSRTPKKKHSHKKCMPCVETQVFAPGHTFFILSFLYGVLRKTTMSASVRSKSLYNLPKQYITDEHQAKSDQQCICRAAFASVGMGFRDHFIADHI